MPVYVEPYQPIYPTAYLDEIQVGYVDFLRQLDTWVFALGSNADYRKKKEVLRKQFGCDPAVGDILWGLMNDSMVSKCEHEIERRDMRDLMNEFRRFEKKVKR